MSPVLDRAAIQTILPHRDPFLFVDEIQKIVPAERIVGLFQVRESATFLGRDEAGNPYLPSTLLAEAMAQVGAILVLYGEGNRGRPIYFRAIERARFRRKVPVGSTVRVEAVVRRMRGRLGSLRVRAFLEDELAAEGVMAFALSG